MFVNLTFGRGFQGDRDVRFRVESLGIRNRDARRNALGRCTSRHLWPGAFGASDLGKPWSDLFRVHERLWGSKGAWVRGCGFRVQVQQHCNIGP